MRRIVTITISGDVDDGINLSSFVAEILRSHADDIENQNHIAGKGARGVYTETVGFARVEIAWEAKYEAADGTVRCRADEPLQPGDADG